MADRFKNFPPELVGPGEYHSEIVADAGNDLDPIPRGIYCAEDGDITLVDRTGTALVYSMTAGQVIPFRVRRVSLITGGKFYSWS